MTDVSFRPVRRFGFPAPQSLLGNPLPPSAFHVQAAHIVKRNPVIGFVYMFCHLRPVHVKFTHSTDVLLLPLLQETPGLPDICEVTEGVRARQLVNRTKNQGWRRTLFHKNKTKSLAGSKGDRNVKLRQKASYLLADSRNIRYRSSWANKRPTLNLRHSSRITLMAGKTVTTQNMT